MSKFPYKWFLADKYKDATKNNYNVFGTFICGGGSTMGYKLAGFTHLGGVEIDKKIADVYVENHHPKYIFNEDIRAFNKRADLPNELYDLDILDGSPPCSTFSTSGSREKAWGKEKQFREGQTMQTLDDLVFVYCDTIIKLQPKVFLLENVTGIIKGNAKIYSKKIVEKMTNAGYAVQVFCLNAASMGVPQRRERVFFIGHKKVFMLPKMQLSFNEPPILFRNIKESNCKSKECFIFSNGEKIRLDLAVYGDKSLKQANRRLKGGNVDAFFSQGLVYEDNVMCTIMGQEKSFLFSEKRRLSYNEIKLCGSYPLDYNFKDVNSNYLIGMSVPPVMTAQIANQIKVQWLDNIK